MAGGPAPLTRDQQRPQMNDPSQDDHATARARQSLLAAAVVPKDGYATPLRQLAGFDIGHIRLKIVRVPSSARVGPTCRIAL